MAGLEIRFLGYLLGSLGVIIHLRGRLDLLGELRVLVSFWTVIAGTERIRRQYSSFWAAFGITESSSTSYKTVRR